MALVMAAAPQDGALRDRQAAKPAQITLLCADLSRIGRPHRCVLVSRGELRRRAMRVLRMAALAALAWPGGALPSAVAKPCITIVTHDDDRLGFRNACGVCRRAVWSWGAGQSYFSREGKVEGVWH